MNCPARVRGNNEFSLLLERVNQVSRGKMSVFVTPPYPWL